MADDLLNETGVLFARNTFVSGFGSLFDFCGLTRQYNVAESGDEADARAMYADFLAVGNDLRRAMNEFDRERAG